MEATQHTDADFQPAHKSSVFAFPFFLTIPGEFHFSLNSFLRG
jgi:hypothetical protein